MHFKDQNSKYEIKYHERQIKKSKQIFQQLKILELGNQFYNNLGFWIFFVGVCVSHY